MFTNGLWSRISTFSIHLPCLASSLLVPLVAWRRKANNRKWSHIIIRHRGDMGRMERRKAEQSCCIPAAKGSSRQFAARHYRQQEMPEMLLHIEMEKARGEGGRSDSKLFLCVYSRFLPHEDCCHSLCELQFCTSRE